MAKTKANRAEWYKTWAKKNPDKIKIYQARYRAKKAKEKAELQGDPNE